MTGPVLRTDLVTVFRLRAFVPPEIAERVRADLRALYGVRHVMVSVDPGHEAALVTADVDPSAADKVLEDIREIGVASGRPQPVPRREDHARGHRPDRRDEARLGGGPR